jgi:hypothetical protein
MSFKDHQMSLVHRSIDLPNKAAWKFLVNHTRNLPCPAEEQTELLRWTWTFRQHELKKKREKERIAKRAAWYAAKGRKPPADPI